MRFRLIAIIPVGLATNAPPYEEAMFPNVLAVETESEDVAEISLELSYSFRAMEVGRSVGFVRVWNLVSTTEDLLQHCVREDVLTEWENFNGPQLQEFVNDEAMDTQERGIAFRGALSAMAMLHVGHPSIPARELAEHVGFFQFCSKSNYARIPFHNSFNLDIRLDMYERNARARTIAALNGVAELGALCPELLGDRTTIELRRMILTHRAIRAIPPHWQASRKIHITVNAVGAFHDSRSLLLGPVASLLEKRFSVTTRTADGKSEKLHDWFVAVNNDLGPSPVADTALGRFLALCLLHGEPSLYQVPLELARYLVNDEGADILYGSAVEIDSGFHDLISRGTLIGFTAEKLIDMLRTGAQERERSIPSIIPFLHADAAPSALALHISRNTQGDSDFMVLRQISQHLRQTFVLDNPLEKWTNAGGPELLKFTYELLSKPNDFLRAKVEALKGLMVLVADSGADSQATGIQEFCQTHQFELEVLLTGSVLTEGHMRHVLFSYPANRREAVAMNCFAADWFTQCSSVLASDYLKGIALSHMVVRDIALSSDPSAFAKRLFSMKYAQDSNEHSPDFVGRQIGWYIVDQNSTSMPQIPLSAYQAALSGHGPVAAGLAAVITPASIARFASLDISPAVLERIVSLNPVRELAPIARRSGAPEWMYTQDEDSVRSAYRRYGMRPRGIWALCHNVVRTASENEIVDLLAYSDEIGLNKLCINRPAHCRFVFEWTEFSESPEVALRVLEALPSLFPEFWAANRADLSPLVFRARLAQKSLRNAGIKEIHVRRAHVLEDSWNWLAEGPAGLHLRLRSATFADELGFGQGLFGEWFSLLALQLGQRVLQLRSELPQYYIPNPGASRVELVALGRLLGLALVLEKPIPLGLPLMLFAGLLPAYTGYMADLAEDDPAMFASYQIILGMSENVLKDAEIEINSVVVTVANRDQLIRDAIRGPFQGKAMEAILDGFSDIVPPEAFLHTGIISADELQLLIQGQPGVDVGDMQVNVKRLESYKSNDDQIVWLFSFLEASDLETRRKFLHFVTGLAAVGVGGFSKNPISISYISGADTSLPSSHTCSRQLDLPKYSSRAVLEAKLTIAINADPAMGTV